MLQITRGIYYRQNKKKRTCTDLLQEHVVHRRNLDKLVQRRSINGVLCSWSNRGNHCQLCGGAGGGNEAEAALPKLEMTVPIRACPTKQNLYSTSPMDVIVLTVHLSLRSIKYLQSKGRRLLQVVLHSPLVACAHLCCELTSHK